jgi:DNA polymerase-1
MDECGAGGLAALLRGDVRATERLFFRMLPMLDIERALVRGQFMSTAAHIEACGVPIDTASLAILRNRWEHLPDRLIKRIDADYGAYEIRTFKVSRWAKWCDSNSVPWPHLPSGHLALDDDTFREMARRYPAVAPMRGLRATLSQLRLENLAVGQDGRNRCPLSAFGARTGRNKPSSNQFIFGPSVWLRGLVRPQPDTALAYIDYSQQEFGIAAAVSGDAAMLAAYASGDPYLAFPGRQEPSLPMRRRRPTARSANCSRPVPWASSTAWGRRGSPPGLARE